MMKKIALFCFLSLYAEKIDIIANFDFDEISPRAKIAQETGFELRSLRHSGFENYMQSFYTPDVKKIFLMNDVWPAADVAKLPKEKLVLFSWEPGLPREDYCDLFSRVYTLHDVVLDGVRYFKFYYPTLRPTSSPLLPFEERQLCTMVASCARDDRIKIIKFFETKPVEDFAFYGFIPLIPSDRYRGTIAGVPWSPEKVALLQQYRFCICFEGCSCSGFITEKIFVCFTAGCIPIYWGAPNIEEYIPKDCFISYDDFESDEHLYHFLKTMSKETYQQYLNNILSFLQTKQAHLFSQEHLSEIIYEAATH